MISIFENNVFALDTNKTTYAFRVMETGQLEHLYYGPHIHVDADTELGDSHCTAHGNSTLYDNSHPEFSLEDVDLECSSYGKGDIREPMIEITAPDGSRTLDLVYDSHELLDDKVFFDTLPTSYDDEGNSDHMVITLLDKNHGYRLKLYYSVYPDNDVITRSACFINSSDDKVELNRAMGALIDFPESGYKITSFHGAWTREMGRYDTVLTGGKYVNSSFTGTSSSRSNPLVLMARDNTDEDMGLCFGFNTVYSGNHYEAFEVNSFGKTRFVAGINPACFSFTLEKGEKFEIPEVVMTCSDKGYNGISCNFHRFVRKHIIRGRYRDALRPVLLNSWEANYFNIDEGKLTRLAKKGKEAGVELFVMDDGWFGERNDDKRALGDWTENKKKLPGGLKGIADKIHGIGMDFGVWIEPEMINADSDLYRSNPNWSMEIPGMDHSEGRNQRLLDLANPEVVDYMIEAISKILKSADINYVKWDMNRIVSDVYSRYLPTERQGEVLHRYCMGFYRMARELTERFPDILFEGCAAGGNRFDLGALSYFPQIWASDNTDAISRLTIQNGYSYGYPQNSYTAHISDVPNHQTLRSTSLYTRAAVASFGNFGLELNLIDMSGNDLENIKYCIDTYKSHRETFQMGQMYRGRHDDITEWTIVSVDKNHAVGLIAKNKIEPADPHLTYFAKGLDPEKKYHFGNDPHKVSVKTFGSLVNTVGLPVHVKQNSALHNVIDHFYHLDGEAEDTDKYGDTLMNAGQKLRQSYIGTGIEGVRVVKDFDSRMYFMDEVQTDDAGIMLEAKADGKSMGSEK